MENLLGKASKEGDINEVKRLIREGVDIQVLLHCGYTDDFKGKRTPLIIASSEGHVDVVQTLLRAGASVYSKDSLQGRSALHFASAGGHLPVVRLLLDSGSPLDDQDGNDGDTPLHLAVCNGYEQIVLELLKKGANVHLTTRLHGHNPLHIACKAGNSKCVKLLLDVGGARPNDADEYDGFTPLHHAVFHGHKDIATALLQRGANVFARDKHGHSPVYLAVSRGSVTDTILSIVHQSEETYGEVIETKDWLKTYEKNVLCQACRQGDFVKVKQLIKEGHSLEEKVVYNHPKWTSRRLSMAQCTPLQIASAEGHYEMVQELIKAGANVHDQDPVLNMTCLGCASASGHLSIVKLLLKHKCDVNQGNLDNSTPLILAASYGHSEIVSELLKNEADVRMTRTNRRGPLHVACKNGHIECVRLLLDAGCKIEEPDWWDKTPLDLASNDVIRTELKLRLEQNTANVPHEEISSNGPKHSQKERYFIPLQGPLSQLDSPEFNYLLKSEGAITLHITKCTTIGPPRKGKTCLKYLLTDQEWDIKETTKSTVVMEAPEWVECFSSERHSSIWKVYSRNERELDTLQVVKRRLYNTTATAASVPQQRLSDQQPFCDNKDPQGMSLESPVTTTVIVESSESVPNISITNERKVLEDVYSDKKEEFLDKLQHTNQSGSRSHHEKVINFIDTGGQGIYHDVHPVLITTPSVYLVVFSLKDIQEQPCTDFMSDNLLLCALRSIHSLGNKQPQANSEFLAFHPKYPKIFIVGTHLDLIHPDSPDKRQDFLHTLHKEIDAKLLNQPYSNFVHYDTQGMAFWAVDNTQAGLSDNQEYYNSLRKRIQEKSTDIQMKLPLTWYLLEHLTNACKRGYFTYKELEKFSLSRDFVKSKEHFKTMVHLFHVLGFFYFKVPHGYTTEDSIIFTDPNVLYKTTSSLLLEVQKTLQSESDKSVLPCMVPIDIFQTLNDLDNFGEDLINPKWFVALLEDLNLIAVIHGEGGASSPSWIVPAALPTSPKPHANPSEDSLLFTLISSSTESASFIPSGLYCALISDLTRNAKSWRLIEFYRNYVLFSAAEDCKIGIYERNSFIEVTCSSEEKTDTQLQYHIYQMVYERLEETWNRLYEDLSLSHKSLGICKKGLRFGFLCRCQSQSRLTPSLLTVPQFHVAEFMEDEMCYCAQCTEADSFFVQTVLPRQLAWITN